MMTLNCASKTISTGDMTQVQLPKASRNRGTGCASSASWACAKRSSAATTTSRTASMCRKEHQSSSFHQGGLLVLAPHHAGLEEGSHVHELQKKRSSSSCLHRLVATSGSWKQLPSAGVLSKSNKAMLWSSHIFHVVVTVICFFCVGPAPGGALGMNILLQGGSVRDASCAPLISGQNSVELSGYAPMLPAFQRAFTGSGPTLLPSSRRRSRRAASADAFNLQDMVKFSQKRPRSLVYFSNPMMPSITPLVKGGQILTENISMHKFTRPLGTVMPPGQPTNQMNLQVFSQTEYMIQASTYCISEEEAAKNLSLLRENLGLMHFVKYNLAGDCILGLTRAHHGSVFFDFPAVEFPTNEDKILRFELARGGNFIYSNGVPGQDRAHGSMVSYERLGYLLSDKSPLDAFGLASETISATTTYDLLASNCLNYVSLLAASALSANTLNLQQLPEDKEKHCIKNSNCLARTGNMLRNAWSCCAGGCAQVQDSEPFDDLSRTHLKLNQWSQPSSRKKKRALFWCC
ncbi:unnamed protein product [Amoebophrya sp. A25]|nr:unnamed protein product [Amoebophrya sp. A25]|eukprot:GSA25T00000597001.1